MQEKTNAFIESIVIISSIFTLVAVFVVAYMLYFKRRKTSLLNEKEQLKEAFNQQLLQAQIEVQETTFQHIGKELHDNVGQLLSSTKLLLGVTEMNMQQVPDTLSIACTTLSQAIQELRLVSRSLDKEWLEQFSFIENLKSEIERINGSGTIDAICMCDIYIPLEPQEQIILYRIVQEAMQNALKHAQANKLMIEVTEDNNLLQVKVTDDGIGLPQDFSGMGTTNMRHRTKLFGGTITWQRNFDQGTIVIISIPIKDIPNED
jgi:signal transduction histidine kinase